MATTALMTAEDLYALPDERRGELIRGGMSTVAAVGNPHWRLTGRLIRWVSAFVYERGLGEVGPEGGFILGRDPDTVLAPDLAFVRADRLPSLDVQGYLALAPDLAVEVISPSNSAAQIAEKVALYLEAGTRLVWVVDAPRRSVTSHAPGRPPRTLGVGDALDGEDVLPGFALPLADLFG
jgi:Uma2 family endonuclease